MFKFSVKLILVILILGASLYFAPEETVDVFKSVFKWAVTVFEKGSGMIRGLVQ